MQTIEQMQKALNDATKTILPDYEWVRLGSLDNPYLGFSQMDNGQFVNGSRLDRNVHEALTKALFDAGVLKTRTSSPDNPIQHGKAGANNTETFRFIGHKDLSRHFPALLTDTNWIKTYTESMKKSIDQIRPPIALHEVTDRHGNAKVYVRLDEISKAQATTLVDYLNNAKIKFERKGTTAFGEGITNPFTALRDIVHGRISDDLSMIKEGTPVISIDKKDLPRFQAYMDQIRAAHVGGESKARVPSSAAKHFTADPVDRALDLRAEKLAENIKTEIGILSKDAQEKVLEKLGKILGKGGLKILPFTAVGIAVHEYLGLKEASAKMVSEGLLTEVEADRYKMDVLKSSVELETVDPTIVIAEGAAHFRFSRFLDSLPPEKRDAASERLKPPSIVREVKELWPSIKGAVADWVDTYAPRDTQTIKPLSDKDRAAVDDWLMTIKTDSLLDQKVTPEFEAAASDTPKATPGAGLDIKPKM